MDRSVEDINKVLLLAKLNIQDLQPTSQTIYFTDNFTDTQDDCKLLQLNPHITEHLKAGDTLYLNGDPNDNSVLCTNNRTYEVVSAETSNSLLLIEHLKFNQNLKDETERKVDKLHVDGVFHEYYELNQIKPQLQRVNRLLEKTVFNGPENEYKINKDDLLTFDELWVKSQSSKEELHEALNEMQVIVIDNKMRLLDFEYHFRILSLMLNLIDENSWGLDDISYEDTMESLSDLAPSSVLNCLFNLYTEKSRVVDLLQLYRYKEDAVCKFFAQVLLHSAGKFNLSEFLQAWRESVPEGMVPEEKMLHGIAIINRKSMPHVIWAFPESQLPENINDRFKALFNAKEKWSVPEISPYIQKLTTDRLDVNALLAKHARASKIDGVKYYSSKHAK